MSVHKSGIKVGWCTYIYRPVVLSQGDFTLRGHEAVSGDIFGSHPGGSYWWYWCPRGQGHSWNPTVHSEGSSKNYPAQMSIVLSLRNPDTEKGTLNSVLSKYRFYIIACENFTSVHLFFVCIWTWMVFFFHNMYLCILWKNMVQIVFLTKHSILHYWHSINVCWVEFYVAGCSSLSRSFCIQDLIYILYLIWSFCVKHKVQSE